MITNWLRYFKRAAKQSLMWSLIFGLELVASAFLFVGTKTFVATHSGGGMLSGVRLVSTPGVHPHLMFACEQATESLRALFSDSNVVSDLKEMGAGVSLSLSDLSSGRAQVVQALNRAGIPLIAWLALPKKQGYYVNASNTRDAVARFAEFEKWTAEYRLHWAGVGLDIEPNIQEFEAVGQNSKWRLAATLIGRCFDPGRVSRARAAYTAFIREIQAHGYPVETYQFPFIADERRAHSTLLERLFGIVDVRGKREVLMLYSSFNHAAGSALIWSYGPDAQAIVVGVTNGGPEVPAKFAPLNWDELSSDLIVASHFCSVVGIYNLEGCVRRGYLSRLKTIDWAQSVTISANAVRTIILFRARIQAVLWTASHLWYFIVLIVLIDVCLIWRWRVRREIPRSHRKRERMD
jgi:hypothetical protein